MTDSLPDTKFYIPRKRENAVKRPRLTETIQSGIRKEGNIVLLCGPAGFGKTSILSEFVAEHKKSIAWVSLDEGDNDPIRFWSAVIKACQSVLAGFGDSALELFRATQAFAAETIPTLLINDLANQETDLVLILDDFHLIHNQDIQAAFGFLIEHLPGKLHLLVATRIDPPWPLARLRARNQLTEIRASDLRFGKLETVEFLNHTMDLHLTVESIAALETRTEGWAAGLQLAALSIRTQSDPAAFIKAFTGSHIYIAEYLLDEVFQNQSPEIQSFLLQTSILDRLEARLCEAVTHCQNGQALLLALYRSNLFVTALDDEGRWYRYHQLFADLLQARLSQTHQISEIHALHQRAAAWYETNGMELEAINHALSGKEYPKVLQLLENMALPMILQAHVKTVENWMNSIPMQYLEESPRIKVACAWMHLLRGAGDQARPYLEGLESFFARTDASQIDPALLGEWWSLQARLFNQAGKHSECIQRAQQALQILPETEAPVRTLLILEMATACQQSGNYEEAAGYFQRLAREAREKGDATAELLGISGHARMALQQGKLKVAFQIASRQIEKLESHGKITPFAATLYGELGQIYYQWHQLEKAQEFLFRANQASGHSGYSDPDMYYHVILSRISQMRGDWNSAASEMKTVRALIEHTPPAMIGESVIVQRVRVALAFNDFASARELLLENGVQLEPASRFLSSAAELNYTHPAGLLFNCGLRTLFYEAQTSLNLRAIPPLIEAASAALAGELIWQQNTNALETLLLRSQMHAFVGDEGHSLNDVERALELAEPENFISPFVEEGAPVGNMLATLLKTHKNKKTRLDFIRSILSAFPGTFPPKTERHTPPIQITKPDRDEDEEDQSLIKPLTRRELEILRMIAAGASNQNIAEKLVITVSAVKKHTSNIYNKLGVNSRTLAAARARKLGLL